MNNPTTFSYTFSANPAPRRPEPDADLFAVDKLSQFPLSSDQVLARNPSSGREMVVPADYLNTLMGHCSVFRTLDGHVTELMKGSDGSLAREAAIRKVVESFRDGGLTISAAEICRELAPAAAASPITDRPVVVILTCDRPHVLERLLGSIVANCDLAAIDRLFVVDDSRSAENGARNRELTETAGTGTAAGFHYFGADEARELTDALARQLPQHEEAIRFLLDRDRWQDQKSYGLARNFSHLLSVGKPVVVFDDDALCEAYDVPFRQPGVSFAARQQEFAGFADNAEWQAAATRLDHDPVTGLMQCLGLEVPQALSVLGFANLDQSALRPAPLDFARQLRRDSRVLITECGSLGDPGTGTNRWLANIPPASRERLLAREGGLQLALQQRCCWLGREQPEFHPNSKISQVTGFDNRDFLPPYFPITRGEDRLFGQVVKFIYPHSVALEYAWAAPHLPIPERAWAPEENRYSISGRSFPGTMIEALFRSSGSCLATNVQDRLAYLARLLEDLAAAPDDSLLSRLAEDRHAYRASQMRKLKEQIAESAGLPEDWRNYISDALRQVESSDLGDFAMDGLKGSVGDLEGAGLVRFWRDAWRSFGRSMLAWGDIREAARDIVEKKYP